jgi:hypothetical protein
VPLLLLRPRTQAPLSYLLVSRLSLSYLMDSLKWLQMLAAVLNRVYARHKHHEPVANIFGGIQAKLIVAYTKTRSIGARLFDSCTPSL